MIASHFKIPPMPIEFPAFGDFENGNPTISTDKNPSSVCYNSLGDYDVTLVTVHSF
jgi:hypothetical protein